MSFCERAVDLEPLLHPAHARVLRRGRRYLNDSEASKRVGRTLARRHPCLPVSVAGIGESRQARTRGFRAFVTDPCRTIAHKKRLGDELCSQVAKGGPPLLEVAIPGARRVDREGLSGYQRAVGAACGTLQIDRIHSIVGSQLAADTETRRHNTARKKRRNRKNSSINVPTR